MATTTRAPGMHRYRPGLGDLAVLLALLLLLWTTLGPHYTGRRLAHRETEALARLDRLHDAVVASGLVAALDDAYPKVVAIDGVRARDDDLATGAAPGFLPQWEDHDYYYRLDLTPRLARRFLVDATPRKPGLSGCTAYRVAASGALVELPLDTAEPATTAGGAEVRAREVAVRIASIAVAAGLPAAIRDFARRALGLGFVAVATDEGTGPPLDGRKAYPRWTAGGTYRYAACIVPGATPESGDIELLAWPERPGTTGYAAFRRTRTDGRQQSRNIVRRYAGGDTLPLPGAGRMRPGSGRDGPGGFTGIDGNRWFPLPER